MKGKIASIGVGVAALALCLPQTAWADGQAGAPGGGGHVRFWSEGGVYDTACDGYGPEFQWRIPNTGLGGGDVNRMGCGTNLKYDDYNLPEPAQIEYRVRLVKPGAPWSAWHRDHT
jgi:hypothetical protein